MGRMFYWYKFNRVELRIEFRRFIKKKLRFTYFFLFMLTRGYIFITREIKPSVFVFNFTFISRYFILNSIHILQNHRQHYLKYQNRHLQYLKLCISVTTFYLDSIYLLQIQRPPASHIT
mgnify:CR=1 FL=1